MLSSMLWRTQLLVGFIIGGLGIALGETAAPSDASVYIISPRDGDAVTNPIKVQFGLAWVLRRPASTSQAQATTIC